MERKKLLIGAIILIVICAGLAIAIVLATNGSGGEAEKAYALTGTWTEDSTGVEITIKDNGVFQVLGNDAAKYTLEKEAANTGIITLEYAEIYGGQKTIMHYTVSETQLTFTQDSTGEIQTYTREAQVNSH